MTAAEHYEETEAEAWTRGAITSDHEYPDQLDTRIRALLASIKTRFGDLTEDDRHRWGSGGQCALRCLVPVDALHSSPTCWLTGAAFSRRWLAASKDHQTSKFSKSSRCDGQCRTRAQIGRWGSF